MVPRPSQHDDNHDVLEDQTTKKRRDEKNHGAGELLVEEETWVNADGENVFDVLDLKTKHSVFKLRIGRHRFKLKAMVGSNLSPLDMDYGSEKESATTTTTNEFSDGTGHLIWLASMAFMHLLEEGGDGEASLLADLFDCKTVLELGCGTGAASICVSRLCQPQKVVMTDNDPEALKLAKENCELNKVSEELVYVKHLEWSDSYSYAGDALQKDENNHVNGYDTVLATDVLYDLKMITPMLQTAFVSLKRGGNLCLSHVPRFCIPNSNDSKKDDDGMNPLERLENHIVELAKKTGFTLNETIRPDQVLLELPRQSERPTDLSLETLEQAHAVIYIFSKAE